MILFFFNDTATTEIYTLSLHDALPIYGEVVERSANHDHIGRQELAHQGFGDGVLCALGFRRGGLAGRSEEHTSELQSHLNLVCRLLLEKKKNNESDLLSQIRRTALHVS